MNSLEGYNHPQLYTELMRLEDRATELNALIAKYTIEQAVIDMERDAVIHLLGTVSLEVRHGKQT